MMTDNLELSTQAYCKMFMHAMKYPHCVCNGLLLSPKSKGRGENEEDDSENDSQQALGEAGDSRTTTIKDAIPISHASHCLAPNIEIAYNSVSVYAQEQGLVIAGYYQTGRYNDDSRMDAFSVRIADRICETNPGAVLCFIDFKPDQSDPQTIVDIHKLIDGKWRPIPSSSLCNEHELEPIANTVLYTKEKLYREIVDFDEHFNNIALDWTNASVSQKIDHLVASVC